MYVFRAARGEMLLQPGQMERVLAREREVLAGIARGERSKEIAARLGITRRTVESYLNSIYIRLNVDSRAAAVAVAIEHGLLPRSPDHD